MARKADFVNEAKLLIWKPCNFLFKYPKLLPFRFTKQGLFKFITVLFIDRTF